MSEQPPVVNVTQIHKGCGSGCASTIGGIFILLLLLAWLGGVMNRTPSVPSPTPTPTPTATIPASGLPALITVTKEVSITLPYGVTRIPPGTKVKPVKRVGNEVEIAYMDAHYRIPIDHTDYRP